MLSVSGLIEDTWISIFSSAFTLLKYVFMVEIREENLTSLGYVVGKARRF